MMHSINTILLDRLGCSLGGHNSLFLAAFDERVALAVTSCGFDSFKHCENLPAGVVRCP